MRARALVVALALAFQGATGCTFAPWIPPRAREGAVVVRCYQSRTATSSSSRLVVVLVWKREGAPPQTLGQMEVDGECRWTVHDESHTATVAPEGELEAE
jgi:hypothetical protein